MALLANYNSGVVSGTAYFTVERYTTNLRNKTVEGRLEVYTDAPKRNARKASDAALVALRTQVLAKEKANAELNAAFDAKSQEDKERGINAYLATAERMKVEIDALKAQESEERTAYEANRPGDVVDFRIPAGGVQFAADGSVGLDAIYAWLAKNDLAGGKKA